MDNICENMETNEIVMSIDKIRNVLSEQLINVLMERRINVLHVVIIAPMIGYIGYLAIMNKPIKFGMFLIILAILMAIYHAYKILDYFAMEFKIETPTTTTKPSTSTPSTTTPSSTEKENYENNESIETKCLETFMNGYNNETNKEHFRSESFTIRNNGESIDDQIEDGKLHFTCSSNFNIYMDTDQEGQTVKKYTDLSIGQCYNKLNEQENKDAKGIVYHPNTKECSTIKDRVHPKSVSFWNIFGPKPFYKNLNSILVRKK
jgi:hypothetical protein